MKLTPILFGVAFGCHTETTNNNCTAINQGQCHQGLEGAELPIGLGLFTASFKDYSSILTLIRTFLRPSPSAFFVKKSRIITGGFTVGNKGIQIICADKVPVGPILVSICCAEQKYMSLFGTVIFQSTGK